jgi:hypothetical protein
LALFMASSIKNLRALLISRKIFNMKNWSAMLTNTSMHRMVIIYLSCMDYNGPHLGEDMAPP